MFPSNSIPAIAKSLREETGNIPSFPFRPVTKALQGLSFRAPRFGARNLLFPWLDEKADSSLRSE
jgi:hypothetical protein